MRNVLIIFGVTFMIFSLSIQQVFAYGWGYKRNNTNDVPEIGRYEQILDGHRAYYADLSGEKVIYITFDNGYEQGYTSQVLDILKEEEVPATFFVTGHYVEQEPELINRMVEEGHIVGNHSYSHPDFTVLSKDRIKDELDRVEQAVAEISNQKQMQYVRPPRGTFNERTLQWVDELGYFHIFWSVAFIDWEVNRQKGWQYAYESIMNRIHPGAIVLLHTVSQDNAEALKKVIQELKRQGYTFKSLDDLIFEKEFLPNFSF